jgi:hypothetical protein
MARLVGFPVVYEEGKSDAATAATLGGVVEALYHYVS